LPAAVSSAIRLDIAAEKPCPDLIPFLSDKQILLVLDNCEHIIEAAAVLAFRVLRAAPSVQILATSREPFGLEGEFLHRLKPLGFPSVSHGLSAAVALDFPAIQLFIEHAANALGGFSLRDLDVPVVVDICRKLDGIPLAIVLAAGTVDALGLWGVLSRMDDPLRLPVTRHCTAIPHHRTLRANLDWSYRLLAQEEQQTLRRLSVFTGSFTMAAAAMIATDPTCIEYEIVDRVVALVAKSLIEADADGSATRLRLLATTRAYARERLAESGEEVGILRRRAGLR
jgi:predicted ATPase